MSGSGTSPAAGSAGTGKTPAATETPKGAQHNCQTFHCNFCHHLAKEPVLSYCGHLFCWSCLHQKLETKSSPSVCSTTPSTKSTTNESVKSIIAVSKATDSPVISIPCPVCSVNIDENQIVPMYSKDADVGNKKPKLAAKPRPRIGPLQAVNPDSRTTDLIIVAWFVFLVGVWYFLL